MPTPVSLYIIAYQEAANLREVLPTVLWADEVVVVDSFSTDETAQLCVEFGVRHVNLPFNGFGKLRNEALALLEHNWVVSIDSDERSTPEFAAEVRATLAAPQHPAYFVPRRNTFLGHPIRHCGWYPDYRQPQVFDRRRFQYREDLVHESFKCDGTPGYFKNFVWQHPFPSFSVVLTKTQKYTELVARQKFAAGQRAGLLQLVFNPVAAFVKKYFFQQGFRDGTPGFLVSAQHGYYTFLKYARLWELQNNARNQAGKDPG